MESSVIKLELTPDSNAISIADFYQDKRALRVTWSDGRRAQYHYLWLRDNCQSAFHPITQERNFDMLSVSDDIHPLEVRCDEQGIVIRWSEGELVSRYSLDWLRRHAYSPDFLKNQGGDVCSWDCSYAGGIQRGEYSAVIEDDSALCEWMQQLSRYGLALVSDMPSTPEAVVEVAERIGYLRRTNFGLTFDVRSVPKPINQAYTAEALPLHTDLPNHETPPGYQFLHCLNNESEGGASTFVDAFRVIEDIRENAPDYFELLARQPIPFRYHDEEYEICEHRTVINLNHLNEVTEIKYNAHLADIFDLPEEIMDQYYLAYRYLMTRLRDPRYMIRLKLNGGDMVVFDNRRVLHGRDQFDPSTGLRHLRGCYVDRTEFKSRLRVLERRQCE
ncbi:TauD/TfdA family dioxygenase [Oceanimonas sp. MB9]|uniref:TauD/TfdA family dioxygenase n=1 Tax=Oceanimonas sp. MB9 TaxID=2588453 RepID=UPI0013F636F7|nr:TauD/TfdA family dioxygenase [Oceanimonas sp. MB9]NHI01843.1 Gamma-butyrobetaine dioxygenase [Oceanimonas sp. MB9]